MTYTLIGVCYPNGFSAACDIPEEKFKPGSPKDIAELFHKETDTTMMNEIYVVGDGLKTVIYKHIEGWKDTP